PCRDVRDSQRALIVSGVVVFFQFALFLLVGAMMWMFYRGAAPAELGMATNDDLFPTFVITEFPPGLSGLFVAGILAAAMSTLSSSLNSLSTSTVSDLYQRFSRRPLADSVILRHGRIWTLVWALVFVVFASLFTGTDNPVVEMGLSIASYTYGALLGAFLLGLLVKRARQGDALVAFGCTVVGVLLIAFGVKIPVGGEDLALAFPWYTPLGVLITLVVGGLLSLRHRDDVPAPASGDDDPVSPDGGTGTRPRVSDADTAGTSS
ncbi:sodium:solute symporter family transporter, partial [Actinoalloteichus caeruleus]|uniref:sodium:solute symporter family transporter n=1 Tax=Actinoalloteichus cyanogriseus TaxID=2893586 RepID=UPI003AA8DE65